LTTVHSSDVVVVAQVATAGPFWHGTEVVVVGSGVEVVVLEDVVVVGSGVADAGDEKVRAANTARVRMLRSFISLTVRKPCVVSTDLVAARPSAPQHRGAPPPRS